MEPGKSSPGTSGLLLLGMHRSGTSAVARALNLCGAWAGEPDDLTGANIENPWGFWERRDVRHICDELLRSMGGDWWKVAQLDVSSVPHSVASEQRGRFGEVVARLEQRGTWLIKEPRLCILLPILRDYLRQAVCIYVVRSPLEVARSLRLRNGFGIAGGLALWEEYNVRALNASRGLRRAILLHDELLRDPQKALAELRETLVGLGVQQLKEVDAELTHGAIDASLYRQKSDQEELCRYLSNSQKELWSLLRNGEALQFEGALFVSCEARQHLADLESSETSVGHFKALAAQKARKTGILERRIGNLTQHVERLNHSSAKRAGAIKYRDARIQELRQVLNEQQGKNTEIDEERKGLLVQRQQFSKEIASQSEKIASQSEEIASQSEKIASQSEEIASQSEEIASQSKEIASIRRETKRLRGEVQLERRRIRGLRNTVSWKITWPLRAMRRTGERLRARLMGTREKREKGKSGGEGKTGGSASGGRVGSTEGDRSSEGSLAVRESEKIAAIVRKHSVVGRDTQAVFETTKGRARAPERTKVTVIAWNVTHNAVGRAYLLADALQQDFDVEILGAAFSRFGENLWKPLRQSSRVRIRAFPGGAFPEHFSRMEHVARQVEGDVIYVSKPRLPSIELGILAKLHRNRPIILDIDDYEPSFFGKRDALSLEEVVGLGESADFLIPYREAWTRYCETLIPHVERLTVSNEALRDRFGGMIVPHVRDERRFDPVLYPREEVRSVLGFSARDKVILFLGTPRTHKGLDRIVAALKGLGRPDYKFLIVGAAEDKKVARLFSGVNRSQVKLVANVPFGDIPGYLCAGDLVCLLQDGEDLTAQYQMPAKFTDALAMGIPIVATEVPPLKKPAEDGLVELLGSASLEEKIDEVFLNLEQHKARALKNRDVFLHSYSYAGVRKRLKNLVEGVLENAKPIPGEFKELVTLHRARFLGEGADLPPALEVVAGWEEEAVRPKKSSHTRRRPASSHRDDKWDIVFFWKQNDSGIYGRRQDMLVKHLLRQEKVHKVLHFDAPIGAGRLFLDVWKARRALRHSQSFWVLWNTLLRSFAWADEGKLKNRAFVFWSNGTWPQVMKGMLRSSAGYAEYVGRVLRHQGIGRRRTIFWVCPRNFEFPSIVDRYQPDMVVADVIDDHRKWSHVGSGYNEKLNQNYREILNRSDVVFANNAALRDEMGRFGTEVRLVPNAAEGSRIRPGVGRRPRELKRMKGPVLGYVGNLDGERLDLELLEVVAKGRPDWNLVFIGSVHQNTDAWALKHLGNVHFLGVKRYQRALEYIRCFDVAMLPHVDSELTRHMNPLKLYVYLAMRVPVVATEVAGVEGFGDLIRVAGCTRQFIEEVEACLGKDVYAEREGAVQAFLEENSWDVRVSYIMDTLQGEFERYEKLVA